MLKSLSKRRKPLNKTGIRKILRTIEKMDLTLAIGLIAAMFSKFVGFIPIVGFWIGIIVSLAVFSKDK